MTSSYVEAHHESLFDRESFWARAARGIDWIKTWDQLLDVANAPSCRWFAGGVLNTCFNAVDRHVVAGRGNQPALIFDSAMTGIQRILTYAELLDATARAAGAMAALGVSKGDRVLIYMPMVPEAAIAMLACARLGAPHSVVFGGFAAKELATRIDDAKPKVIVSASCGFEAIFIPPALPLPPT